MEILLTLKVTVAIESLDKQMYEDERDNLIRAIESFDTIVAIESEEEEEK